MRSYQHKHRLFSKSLKYSRLKLIVQNLPITITLQRRITKGLWLTSKVRTPELACCWGAPPPKVLFLFIFFSRKCQRSRSVLSRFFQKKKEKRSTQFPNYLDPLPTKTFVNYRYRIAVSFFCPPKHAQVSGASGRVNRQVRYQTETVRIILIEINWFPSHWSISIDPSIPSTWI